MCCVVQKSENVFPHHTKSVNLCVIYLISMIWADFSGGKHNLTQIFKEVIIQIPF